MFEETCDVNTSSGLPGIEELFHQLGSQANSLPGSIWLNDTSNRNSFYINICIQLYIYCGITVKIFGISIMIVLICFNITYSNM